MVRTLARVAIALGISALVALVFLMVAGRGFLPQSRSYIWLTADPTDGVWILEIIATQTEMFDQPRPGGDGIWLLCIQENSLGRTNAAVQHWRASTWTIAHVVGPSGRDFDQLEISVPLELENRLDAYIKEQVAPASKALAHWPSVPGTWARSSSSLAWWYRQRKIEWSAVITLCAASIAVGAIVSLLVLPPRIE